MTISQTLHSRWTLSIMVYSLTWGKLHDIVVLSIGYRQDCSLNLIIISLSLSLSPEYATIDSPPRRSCIGLRSLRHMCSWHRLFVLAITVVPLLYLVAIEIAFEVDNERLIY